MASGRVGGTKSKISGQVGSTIYQIRKNDDGSYSQIVTAKGQQTINRTTPRLQAQRMCTGMVESLMKQLAPVGKISMQSGANKSKSLNAFSSFNLRLVAQDCKANWYGNNQFPYPYWMQSKQYEMDLGGPWMLSSGTLQFNLFDGYAQDNRDQWAESPWDGWQYDCYMLKWHIKQGVTNVGQFLASYKITRIDTIVFCGFLDREWCVDEENDEWESLDKHLYLIMHVNPTISDGTPLSPAVLRNLFIIDSNYDFQILFRPDYTEFGIGWVVENYEETGVIYYLGAFSISYLEGKKKISSSRYVGLHGDNTPWISNSWPAYRFGSWMGQYSDHNWPSPFV